MRPFLLYCRASCNFFFCHVFFYQFFFFFFFLSIIESRYSLRLKALELLLLLADRRLEIQVGPVVPILVQLERGIVELQNKSIFFSIIRRFEVMFDTFSFTDEVSLNYFTPEKNAFLAKDSIIFKLFPFH